MKKKQNKERTLIVRMTNAEYLGLEQQQKATTCRSLSEYVRDCLLNKPVITITRNRSNDDLLNELSQVRTELNRIGVNFNQVVRRLHTLSDYGEFKFWLVLFEQEKRRLLPLLDALKTSIKHIALKWLPS